MALPTKRRINMRIRRDLMTMLETEATYRQVTLTEIMESALKDRYTLLTIASFSQEV